MNTTKRGTLKKWILWIVLIDFGIFSSWVMWKVGYLGIWQAGLSSPGAQQILVDLVIAAGLICSWMVVDARKRGVNPWPWVLVTFAAGSFGPLAYLLWREYSSVPEAAGNQTSIISTTT